MNAKMSLQGGWDRDSQAKKGGMAGLTGKMGGKAGSEKPIGDPQAKTAQSLSDFKHKLASLLSMPSTGSH